MRVLIAEKDKNTRTWLRRLLKQRGYETVEAEDETNVKKRIEEYPDLVLAIVRAGWFDREWQTALPVLYLADKLQTSDKQAWTSVGCVDFLCEPFAPDVLLQKVKSLIDRHERYGKEQICGENVIYVQDLAIDPYRCTVTKKGAPVYLTGKEFALLLFFVEHRGETWKPREIYERVWEETFLPSSSNTVMVHIKRLRSKIEDDPASPRILRTLYGKGYQMDGTGWS